MAGLCAGAVLRDVDGETWLELPDDEGVRGVLGDWGIAGRKVRRGGRDRLLVSPLYARLVSHLMPPRSAARISAVRRAGGCPFLSVVLWEMAMARKGRRYMPFPDAVPFGVSKATFFRRGWHRRDLHKIGWLDFGISITPRLRELMTEWFERKTCERNGHAYDPMTYPLSPGLGIPDRLVPPEIEDVPPSPLPLGSPY